MRVVDVHVLRVGGEVVEAVDVVLLKSVLLDEEKWELALLLHRTTLTKDLEKTDYRCFCS